MTAPVVQTPPNGEACLLVLLLDELLPRYLSNPLLGVAVKAAGTLRPVVSVQGGTSTATLRITPSGIVLENGRADDAWAHVSGDVGSLLGAATLEDPLLPFVTGRIRITPRLSALPAAIRRTRRNQEAN